MADDDTRDVLAVLRAQEDAVARGDATAAVAPVAEDAVIYDLPPPLAYRGASAEALAKWFATWEAGVTTELANPTVIVAGDLAVVFGLSRMRGEKKGGGPVDSWNRRTIVLRRTDGNWRIVHEHGSYPMAMDGSGRAMTELKPEAG